MLKKILSVSGKPGLYKMISQGKNMLVVESLVDKKRIPTYIRDKVISLNDIAIYTNDAEIPLRDVLTSLKEKETAQPVAAAVIKSTPDALRAYMEELLPDYDRERVYPTDIKHLLNWYNILINAGITDFSIEGEEKSAEVDSDPAADAAVVSEPVDVAKKPVAGSAAKDNVAKKKSPKAAATKKPTDAKS